MTMIIDGTNGGFFPSWTTATRPASPAVGQMGYNTTIGQFDCYTSGGWVSVATTTSTSNKLTTSQMPTGSVLQVVSFYGTSVDSTSNTGFVNTSATLSITPSSSSNKILLMSAATISMATSNVAKFAFARNGTIVNGGGQNWGAVFQITSAYGTAYGNAWSEIYLDSPATTSAITYTVQFGVDAGGPVYFNGRGAGNGGGATLTALEIAG